MHFKNGIAGLGELWDQVIGDPVLGAGGEHQRDIAIIIVPISSLKKENGANLSDKDQRQAALRIKVLPTASTSPVEGKSVTLLSGKHPETVWETASIGSQDYETSIKTEHGDKNIRVQHFRLPPQDEVLQSGDSGSPVIDSQTGEVVGILTGPVLRIHPSPVAVVSAEDIWAYTEHFRSTMKMTSANHYRQRSTLPALLGEQVQELLERLWKTNEDLAQFLENPSVELANILSGRGSILPSWNEGEIIYSDLREMIQRIIGMRREEFGIESNSTINVKIVTLTDESLVNTNDSYLLATMGIEQHSNASGATDYTIIFSVHNRFWEALRSRASPQREQLQWRLAFHEIDEYLALRYPQSATGQLFSSYLLEHVLHKTTATARELDEIRTSANFHMYIDFLNSLNKKQLRSLSSRETVESAEQRMHNIGDQSKILRFSREVMELDPIIRSFKNAHPKSKESTVERMRAAYEIAVKSYGDSQYVPGKKNLLRFVEDAQTIAQWGGEDSAIVAALLGYSSPDDLRKLWKRRTISKGEAEKLGTMFERRKHNAMLPYVDEDIIKQLRVGDTLDNYIKMIIKNAGDDQTLLLFFVDKLRAVADASTPQERDYRYNELMQVYVPLAMRLNRFDIADDLRDGAMSLIYPHEYAAIKEDVEKNVLKMKRTEAADDLSEMGRELEMWLLGEKGVVKPIVRTRVKSIYSIWEKISSSRREEYTSAEMLNDILGIHIIVESESGRFNTTRYVRGRFESMGYTTTQEETTEKQRGYVSTKLLFSTPGKPPYEVFVFSKAQYDKYRFGLEEAIEGTETVDSQKHAVIPHWIYKLGTHVKRLNGAVVQNVNRVHKQEDGTITEDKKRSHQTFHSDNLRLQGSYAENFKLIYNTMGHIMFVMFLYEDKKGGISVLELPEGARLKHIVNHSGVNGREVGSKGLAKVQLVKIGNNPLVEQSRHNIGESDILSNGDIITFKKNESTTAHRGTVAREAMAAAMQALGPVRAAAKASRVARLALEKHSVTIPGELAGKTVFRYYDTIENIPSGVAEDVQRISEGGSKRNHFNVVYVVSHIPGTGKWGTSLAREIQVERPGGPVTLPLKAGMYKKDENGKTTQLSILAIPGLTAEETPALIRWLNETPQELDTFNTLLELPVKIKPADNETGVRYIIEMNGTSEFNEASLRAQWPLPETAVVKGGTVADAPAAVVLLKMYQRAIIQKSGEAVIKASTTVKNIIISAFRGPSDIGQLTDIGRNSEINSFMNVLPFNDPEDPLAENRAGDIALIDTDMFNIEAAEPAGSEKDYVDREKVLQRKLKMLGKSAKIFFAKDRPAKKEYERFIKTERIWLDPYAKRMAAQLRVSQSVVKYMQWLFDQQLKQAIKDVHAKDSTISFEIDINEANYDDALSAIQRWFMLGFDGVRINLHDTDSMTVDKITRIKEVINSAKPDATIMIEPANAAGIPAVVEGSLVVKQYHDIAPGEVLSGDVIVEMDRNSRPQASQINEMLTRLKGAGGIIYNMGDFEDTLPIGQDRRDNLRYRMRSDGNVERSVSIETTVQWVSALLEYAAANLPQSPRAFYRYYKEVALRMFNTIKANESEMEELAGRGHSDGVYEYRDPHNIHSASFSTIIALFNKMEEDAHGAYQQWAAPKEYISKLWVTYQKVSAADKENYEYALSGFVRGMMESLVEQRYIAAKTGDASLPPELSSDRATFRTLLMVADSLGIKGENVVGSLSRQRPSQHTAPIFELLTMARTSLERAEQAGTTATEVEAGVRTIINPLLSDILDNGQMPVSPSLSQVEAISELLRIFNSIAEKKMLSAARVIDNSAVPATQAILDMLAAG
ncbi:MAG: 4-alpha-glucanotransferase [Endomicrobiales bacterium]